MKGKIPVSLKTVECSDRKSTVSRNTVRQQEAPTEYRSVHGGQYVSENLERIDIRPWRLNHGEGDNMPRYSNTAIALVAARKLEEVEINTILDLIDMSREDEDKEISEKEFDDLVDGVVVHFECLSE
jgi:hypothetical protein